MQEVSECCNDSLSHLEVDEPRACNLDEEHGVLVRSPIVPQLIAAIIECEVLRCHPVCQRVIRVARQVCCLEVGFWVKAERTDVQQPGSFY